MKKNNSTCFYQNNFFDICRSNFDVITSKYFHSLAKDEKVSFVQTRFFRAVVSEDSKHQLQTTDFLGQLFIGARFKQATIGCETDIDYRVYKELPEREFSINQAFFVIRNSFLLKYEATYWLLFKGGIGISFLTYATDVDNYGSLLGNKMGPSFMTSVSLKPIRYAALEIPLVVDLFIERGEINPFITLTGKLKAYPYVEWVHIFAEAGMLHRKHEDYYHERFDSTCFLWRIGGGIEFDVNRTFSSVREISRSIKDKKALGESKEDKLLQKLRELRKAKQNSKIVFDSILFEPNSDQLKEESFHSLDEIAKVLIERDSLYIEIGGYTNFTGLLKEELILSVKRAQSIVLYLAEKGVLLEQMKVAGYGSARLDGGTTVSISEENRKVVIRVLQVIRK